MKKILFLIFSIFLLTTIMASAKSVVVLTTDFGLNNEAVGICHGAILSIDSDIEVVDLCHNVPPYDINQAGLMLKRATTFPKGTVFVTVVDPGVGTTRNSVVVKTSDGFYYIAPNNGLLTYVIKNQGVEKVYELEPLKVNPDWIKGTFDGRDLFSPGGAILAKSEGNMDLIGHEVKKDELLLLDVKEAKVSLKDNKITALYTKRDEPYGNIWTNVTLDDIRSIKLELGDKLIIKFNNKELEIPFVLSFGDVPYGMPLAYINSGQTLAFAINQGNFADTYEIKEGTEIIIIKGKK